MAKTENGGRITMPKNVEEFEYPSKVTFGGVLKGLWRTSKLDTTFHSSMAILLVTGLLIDVLGVVLGGALAPIRQILHGYLGVLWTILLPIYLVKILATKKMRMLMTTTNYVDFVLYLILLVTGVTITSANQIWVDNLPWLTSALSDLRPLAPALHTVTTYLWLLVSILFPGGFLHGIATTYLWTMKKEGNTK
jgi:hypothetical protein